KLSAITLLLSSLANASATSEKIEKYLENEFGDNPRIKSLTVKVADEKALPSLKGWSSYVVDISAYLKEKPKEKIEQKMIWFSNGQVITKELTGLAHGENYVDLVKPDFQKEYYKKENLVSGNANAKHRVAIFSDPLCPFCTSFVPKAIEEMKKQPNDFAVYYYHYPIIRIHPAAAIIVRAAVVAEHKGIKDVTVNMYKTKVNPREKDVAKILKAFNKAVGSNVTQKEVQNPKIAAQIASDEKIARNVFVSGTPSVYFDDKVDKTRTKYKKFLK
ncbi:MAG: thioredoxin domain-containing protein, partial [Campylobacterota bacterium]|nr:thioredoxin domain-containing protein [Campylobacterota bacterium]